MDCEKEYCNLLDAINNINLFPNNDKQKFIIRLQIMKLIEDYKAKQVNMKMFPNIKNDNKTYLLLTKTYYLNVFNSIEKYLESKKSNGNLTKNEYLLLISYFYKLSSIKEIFIFNEDYIRSLQLQKKIIEMMKKYIINQLNCEEDDKK